MFALIAFRRIPGRALVLSMLVATSVPAATPPDLFQARSLKCSMAGGFSTMWRKSNPQTKSARMDSEFTLDSINVRAGSARVITNDGAGDLQVFRSPIGLTFLEVDPAVVDITTALYGMAPSSP